MSESKKRPLTFIFLLFLVWRGIHFYSKNDLNLSQTACMSAKNAPRECIYVRLAGAQKECSIANWPKRWHWKCEIGLFGCACDFNSKSGCHSPADDVSVGWKCDENFPASGQICKINETLRVLFTLSIQLLTHLMRSGLYRQFYAKPIYMFMALSRGR